MESIDHVRTEPSNAEAEKVYQRAYKACEGCRARKAKCVSSATSGSATAGRAPCERCVRSGRDCIVPLETQRGKWKRQKRKAEEAEPGDASASGMVKKLRGSPFPTSVPGSTSPAWDSFTKMHELTEANRDHTTSFSATPPGPTSSSSQVAPLPNSPQASHRDLIRADLQNPADALDILCSVTGQTSAAPSRMPSPPPPVGNEGYAESWTLDASASLANLLREHETVPFLSDACQLIRDGFLLEAKLVQLVDTFIRFYHPYYPLVATRRLALPVLSRFAAEDPILLAAICVIASHSDADSELHLKLLAHVKDMLSGAMWGGCANIGAIEALLLLSEWVAPQLQIHSGEKVKESSMIWMIVGVAVRLGYLQGLDKTSFIDSSGSGCLQAGSRQRRTLAWASCYWSDRSISVRMGRGFWSRGPGPVAARNRGNFPTLSKENQLDGQDYASVMQAHLDLIQLMANVQDTLYPSKARQAQIIERGDYARYLDDFNRGVEAWRDNWAYLHWSRPTWRTLMISFFYLQLYVNSFAFSATIVRAEAGQTDQTPLTTMSVFDEGIGKLPDARFIRTALDAATSLIEEFLQCDEAGQESLLVYMPSRYYSYMIYAAVFGLKAVRVRALAESEAVLVSDLVRRVVKCLRTVAEVCQHPAAQYADLLDAYVLRIRLNLQHESQAGAEDEQPPPGPTEQNADPVDLPAASDFQLSFDFLTAPLYEDNGFATGMNMNGMDSVDPASFGEWASIIEHGMEGLPSLSALFMT